MRKNTKGFTLVEILIVVVILGILAAIVIPQFSDASTQSKKSSSRSTLQSLRSQVQLFKIQHDDVAPTVANFATVMTTETESVAAATAGDSSGNEVGPYIPRVPDNPWSANTPQLISDFSGGCAVEGWVYDPATGNVWIGTSGAPADVVTELTAAGDAF